MSTSTVYITKLAAAERQLKAAVRMFLSGDDELATHTVASASYQLVKDLKKARGRDEVADVYGGMLLTAATEVRNANPPDSLGVGDELVKAAKGLAQTGLTLDVNEFVMSVSDDVAKSYWQNRNRISNFLKHADKDPASAMRSEDVDNLSLILTGLRAYVELNPSGGGMVPEFIAFSLYGLASAKGVRVANEVESTVERLRSLSEPGRRAYCLSCIEALRQAGFGATG